LDSASSEGARCLDLSCGVAASPHPPGFLSVGDRDKVRMHTVEYMSAESSGAWCASGMDNGGNEDSCIILPEWAIRGGPRRTVYHDPSQAGRDG
jgi:hypothetical protein